MWTDKLYFGTFIIIQELEIIKIMIKTLGYSIKYLGTDYILCDAYCSICNT